MELEFEVSDGSWHCSVSIPSEGMPGLPADHVDVHEDSVTVAFEDFIELRLHRDGERLIGTLWESPWASRIPVTWAST